MVPASLSRLRSSRWWAFCSTVVVGLILLQCAVPAEDPQPLDREATIELIEKLGGSVGIDGEQPGEPVWRVDLTGVTVDAETLDRLRIFPDLEKLVLDQTPVDDGLLDRLDKFRKLDDLSLADTKITDAGLGRLVGCRSLKRLDLRGTAVTNQGLLHLAPLRKLSEVIVEETAVTDDGLRQFHTARRKVRAGGGESIPDTPAPGPADEITASPPLLVAAGTQLGTTLNELGRALLPVSLSSPERRRQAVELLERAVRLAPENEQCRLDLADAYLELGTEETVTLALGLYEAALGDHPGNDALISRMAEGYGKLGNFEAAIALAVHRLKRGVKKPFPAALQIAALAAEGGEVARGIQELESVVTVHPQDAGIRLLLATLLLDVGRVDAARVQIDTVLASLRDSDPLVTIARRLRERIRS